MVKASVVIVVKNYWYPCHLPYLPHCKVRMRFPAKSRIFNGALGAEWFISLLMDDCAKRVKGNKLFVKLLSNSLAL